MSDFSRVRRQQILREAEGCLDLMLLCPDRWQPQPATRDVLAERTLQLLDQEPFNGSQRARALYLKGQVFRAMERYDEAVVPLRKSAEQDPENIHIWLALGWCYKRCGRLDLAIQALERALAADDTEAIIFYNLACYWSLAKNPKLALPYLARAFDLDPAYRDHVATESDFDAIRNHPDFQQLTSVIV